MARAVAAVLLCASILAASPRTAIGASPSIAVDAPIGTAHCGPGSSPEPGIQGRVPLEDRRDGRSKLGYSCNLRLLGRYQGEGSSWVSASYGHCAYLSSAYPSELLSGRPGVRVLDVSDPAHPVLTAVLASPAMSGGTWESLKVNQRRGLLGAVAAGASESIGFFDVYDVHTDCAHPRLLNSLGNTQLTLPANGLGHEGGWSPDGRTYWSSGVLLGSLTAIDVSDPQHPRILWTGTTGVAGHGFSLSPDGNRIYLTRAAPGGFDVFDVSSIQSRSVPRTVRFVGRLDEPLADGLYSQHTEFFRDHGRPYLISVDEGGFGGVRIVAISDEQHPRVVREIRLGIQLPSAAATRAHDADGNGIFGYEAHYCALDRATDPTALACGFFESGIRVFDIRDLLHPREIAYFNPGAQTGRNLQLPDSEHAMGTFAGGPQTLTETNQLSGALPSLSGWLGNLATGSHLNRLSTDWCSSPPRFVGRQLWVTCQDNGFLALRFTNGAFPLS